MYNLYNIGVKNSVSEESRIHETCHPLTYAYNDETVGTFVFSGYLRPATNVRTHALKLANFAIFSATYTCES